MSRPRSGTPPIQRCRRIPSALRPTRPFPGCRGRKRPAQDLKDRRLVDPRLDTLKSGCNLSGCRLRAAARDGGDVGCCRVERHAARPKRTRRRNRSCRGHAHSEPDPFSHSGSRIQPGAERPAVCRRSRYADDVRGCASGPFCPRLADHVPAVPAERGRRHASCDASRATTNRIDRIGQIERPRVQAVHSASKRVPSADQATGCGPKSPSSDEIG